MVAEVKCTRVRTETDQQIIMGFTAPLGEIPTTKQLLEFTNPDFLPRAAFELKNVQYPLATGKMYRITIEEI